MAAVSASHSSSKTGVAVDVINAFKTFDGGVDVLRDVSFSVAPGQFLALLGPSGCGKSTLLRMIAGLESCSGGTIQIDAAPAGKRHDQRGTAFVFQDAHLLPWRNVMGNVELPLELMHVDRHQRREMARAAIAEVGLVDAISRYPAQLSGGMRMRVSLARALVTRPRLLLLDEPFAALDELTRNRLDEQLLQLWQTSGMTVLFVTHSVSEAAFLAQRALVFSPRPAAIVADVRIDIAGERTAELRTDPRLLGAMQAIHAALRGEA